MKDLPNAFWAVIIITLAVAVALCALFSPAEKEIKITIIGFAASLASGAFGYIQGFDKGKNSVQIPLNQPASTSTSVQVDTTPNPPPPADPAPKE